MKEHYPKNIKLISYEKLIKNPNEIFIEICDFFNIFDNIDKNRNIILKSVNFCKKENLKKIEEILGHSLAGDRINKNSHMQDYGGLKKESMLSDKELRDIELIFNEFNYSLNDFESNVIELKN